MIVLYIILSMTLLDFLIFLSRVACNMFLGTLMRQLTGCPSFVFVN